MSKEKSAPNKRSVTAANLKRLGATRLADLLVEACQDNAQLKRRLRYELAGEAGSDAIALDIGRRLTTLKKARCFIDWQKCRAFVKSAGLS